jgi:tol-pal system protein YbgF
MKITEHQLFHSFCRMSSLLLVTALVSSCVSTQKIAVVPETDKITNTQQQRQAEQLQDLQGRPTTQQPQSVGAITPEEQIAEPAPEKLEVPETSASAAIYLSAFSALAYGRMNEAETGFLTFLRENPDHQYAANARYWLANAQIALNKTDEAINTLKRIIDDPRATHKTPAALVQLARIYQQQGNTLQAKQQIKLLRSRYPDSPEARHSLAEDIDITQ